ncbi:MAG TPA: hypothetical protein VGN88_11750 [Phycisphaerae bacterium]
MRFFTGSLALIMSCVALPHGMILGKDLPTVDTPVGRLALPVVPNSLVVSPDSSRLVFASKAGEVTLEDKGVFINPKETDPRDDSARAVLNSIRFFIDDKPTISFDTMTTPIFSPDSRRLGYAGQREKKWQVVVDNRTLAQDVEDVPSTPIVFSPDSRHVAWVIARDGKYWVTVDETHWPGLEVGNLGAMAFSPDGSHLAAVGRAKGAWMIFVDGKLLAVPPGPVPTGVRGGGAATVAAHLDRFGQYVWKPDSSGVVFDAAFTNGPWQVFSEGVDGSFGFVSKPLEGLVKRGAAISPDGKHVAFGVLARNTWTVVTDGAAPATASAITQPAGADRFDQIIAESLCFYQPGLEKDAPATLLYLAQKSKKWQLYVNGHAVGESLDAILNGSFLLSPDRHHYTYAGIQGGRTVVVKDGVVVGRHDEGAAMTFAFSPDSQHVGYCAKDGANWYACVDGVGGMPFLAVTAAQVAFSPDSKRLAFAAMTPDRAWRVIIGKDRDMESKPYDGFLKDSHVTWRNDGTVVTIAILKKVATRVEGKP